jgi:hypothetical protein
MNIQANPVTTALITNPPIESQGGPTTTAALKLVGAAGTCVLVTTTTGEGENVLEFNGIGVGSENVEVGSAIDVDVDNGIGDVWDGVRVDDVVELDVSPGVVVEVEVLLGGCVVRVVLDVVLLGVVVVLSLVVVVAIRRGSIRDTVCVR